MTREEAINVLNVVASFQGVMEYLEQHSVSVQDACEMAISALEQQPEKSCETCKYYGVFSTECGRCDDDMTQYATRQQPCEDAVSREDVIALIQCSEYELQDRVDNDAMCDDVRKLPSVTVRQTGEWIEEEGWDGDVYYECSVCKEPFCLIDGTPTDNMYNYCPNCGCRMVEPQESEDKE